MDNVIISTKKTNDKYKNTGITCAVLTAILGLIAIIGYMYLSEHSSEDSLIFLLLVGLFLIGDGIITATLRYINSTSFVDIYEDRITGKGIQNFSPMDFNIKHEQVNNITTEGIWIHIHTTSGIYKIMTDKETAAEVFSYYNK